MEDIEDSSDDLDLALRGYQPSSADYTDSAFSENVNQF